MPLPRYAGVNSGIFSRRAARNNRVGAAAAAAPAHHLLRMPALSTVGDANNAAHGVHFFCQRIVIIITAAAT